jgi:hypothetical protein
VKVLEERGILRFLNELHENVKYKAKEGEVKKKRERSKSQGKVKQER